MRKKSDHNIPNVNNQVNKKKLIPFEKPQRYMRIRLQYSEKRKMTRQWLFPEEIVGIFRRIKSAF